MKYKFFVIPAKEPEAATEALNDFCKQHPVSFIDKELIPDGAESFWSICVTYQIHDKVLSSLEQRKPRVDYKQILSADDFSGYLTLRELRKATAEREGVPAYAVFTNEQLATMIQKRIKTITALSQIENIGKKRVEHYGDEFLLEMKRHWDNLDSQE